MKDTDKKNEERRFRLVRFVPKHPSGFTKEVLQKGLTMEEALNGAITNIPNEVEYIPDDVPYVEEE